MSRRPSSSSSAPRSASSPYPRRTPGQPKSSRQQFSACGACRMRRVRCDLKDFYHSTSPSGIQQPSCSNCRERSIKCVDEFAEVKAVKLLRRGRRLQQVEAVYGKVSGDAPSPSATQSPTSTVFSVAAAPTTHSLIPPMQLAFLKSSFFRRFCVQNPVIEPREFAPRYVAHIEGTSPLHIEGRMLAMVLVIWAASFGIDEFGNENTEIDASENHNPHFTRDGGDNYSNPKRRATLLCTEAMIRELLTLVDLHGLLRRPTWDGVRVLLLLLPLAQGIQSRMERLTMYEATLSQVYSLCNVEDSPSVNSGLGLYCDVLIRARIFWFAHVHEGITMALSGGRLLLDDDDLASFQSSLPPQQSTSVTYSIGSPTDSSRSSSGSPVTPTFPVNSSLEPGHPRAASLYQLTSQYFSLALAVSQVCRSIHSTLTGRQANRRIESGAAVCGAAVVEIWDNLERCWDNFEMLRRNPSGVGAAGGDLIRGEDVERFVSGWQVFIFQCFNVVREALPCLIDNSDAAATMATLHLSAIRRCQKFLPRVIRMLQRHLMVPSSFFAYDAGLIRDGCFFAGLLLAQSDEVDADGDMMGWDADWEEGVMACIQALGEIRWVYSSTQERETTLKAEWEARIERDRRRDQQSPMSFPLKESPGHSPSLNDITPLPCSLGSNSRPRALSLVSAGGQVRSYLPQLSISIPPDDNGPETVLTDDGSGSWEAYTPPSTSGSISTIMSHRSLSPNSPHHPTMISSHVNLKSKDFFGDDDDPFSFTIDGTPDSRTSVGSGVQARWTPFSGNYLDPRVVLGCDSDFSLGSAHRPFFS